MTDSTTGPEPWTPTTVPALSESSEGRPGPPGAGAGGERHSARPSRGWLRGLLGTLALLMLLGPSSTAQETIGSADEEPAAPAAQPAAPSESAPALVPAPSPWYLKRGTKPRPATAADDVPTVLWPLVERMRDNQVPGFYDGQFAGLADDFDGLARLARDETVEHTLRLMAVMALQEAGDGERLAAQLEPLLISVAEEFAVELRASMDNGNTVEEGFVREVLRADLSRHVRFALAKDGQSGPVLAKVEVMEQFIAKHRVDILDPTIKSDKDFLVAHKRGIWFDIAYHYQQFDDYVSAAEWFSQLCDSLTGSDTRWAHYNLGCIAAIQGDTELALGELEEAYFAGFLDVAWMLEDGDLASLRASPRFLELARLMGANEAETGANPNTPSPFDGGEGVGEVP